MLRGKLQNNTWKSTCNRLSGTKRWWPYRIELKLSSQMSNPGIANWLAKDSTRSRSSPMSLLLSRAFRNCLWNFPCSRGTALAIWAALKRKSATVSKSDSRQPLDVIAGVPEQITKNSLIVFPYETWTSIYKLHSEYVREDKMSIRNKNEKT